MNARKPTAQILYNGKDITKDITPYLVELSYEDKVTGESDEISVTLDDSKRLWQNAWYPEKGDQLSVVIGYADLQINCGTFDIDDIELSGPPAQIVIRGIAAVVTKALRTKKSYVHESKTLRQIAKTVADANGLTVVGDIADIRINRTTQNRESELAFLKRIGAEYGYLFSVRDKQLTFTSVYKIDESASVTRIKSVQMSSYSFRDKLEGTYKSAEITYHNVDSRETVTATDTRTATVNGQQVTDATAGDTLSIRSKAENKQQAEAKAKASLYEANTKGQTGNVSVEGSPLLVAGNNVDLTGLGALSGKYQIRGSRHRISVSGGYTTEIEVRRVGYVSDAEKEAETEETQTTSITATQL